MSASPTQAEFLTAVQVCALLGVVTKTLQRWRENGGGPPFIRAGSKLILYRRTDVDAWLKTRTFRHRAEEATAQQAA